MATSAPTRQCVNENRWSIWSFILLSLWQGNVCIPVSSSKCWTCDSIKGPFPLVSAFLNYLLTQIWSLLNPNLDLVSWLATPQNAEWVIYQFLEWWETKWFMAHLSLSFFFYPNLIYVTASVAVLISLLVSSAFPFRSHLSDNNNVCYKFWEALCDPREEIWMIRGWMSVKSTLAQYWHASALACIPGGTYENMQSSTHREEHTCAVSNWINAQVEALPNASYCLSSIPWRMHWMNKTFVNKGIYWFKYNRE